MESKVYFWLDPITLSNHGSVSVLLWMSSFLRGPPMVFRLAVHMPFLLFIDLNIYCFNPALGLLQIQESVNRQIRSNQEKTDSTGRFRHIAQVDFKMGDGMPYKKLNSFKGNLLLIPTAINLHIRKFSAERKTTLTYLARTFTMKWAGNNTLTNMPRSI